MTTTKSSNHTCTICHQHFTEFGHNAEPVAKGRCCNRCNTFVVIPARIRAAREHEEIEHDHD